VGVAASLENALNGKWLLAEPFSLSACQLFEAAVTAAQL
jgi:hypothetical protein